MLARAAQNGQGVPLKPDGCDNNDIPYDFQEAVDQAYRIISWLDNLPSKEIPPIWMWPFDNKVNEWFEAVKQSRDEGGPGPGEEGNMMQNELTKGRGKDS